MEDAMKKGNLKGKPCAKCPYTLGLIRTLTNPCPQCKQNGYESYERFLNLPLQGKSYKNEDE